MIYSGTLSVVELTTFLTVVKLAKTAKHATTVCMTEYLIKERDYKKHVVIPELQSKT